MSLAELSSDHPKDDEFDEISIGREKSFATQYRFGTHDGGFRVPNGEGSNRESFATIIVLFQ